MVGGSNQQGFEPPKCPVNPFTPPQVGMQGIPGLHQFHKSGRQRISCKHQNKICQGWYSISCTDHACNYKLK
eukprot:TRINITY_DN190_c1_g1_i4.p1 TRINITY_DN190_c1_g1~~TRINITY_DN190_c1_g1_i4.p1  ORF type:complete len:72 (+),score=7.91 TRINITY_DN190_c1_g1_i4:187-402(+)